jgi:hypothetical protein
VNRETGRGWFHWPFGEIRLETIKSGLKDLLKGRVEGEKKGTVGIHEEFQTERVEALWILWQAPWEIIGLVFKMPFQSQEAKEEREEGERKDSDWRYLLVSWETHGESEPESNFHPSLEMRARLTSSILLIPTPPRTLGMQMEFHDLRERLLVFYEGKNQHQSASLRKSLGTPAIYLRFHLINDANKSWFFGVTEENRQAKVNGLMVV